jgi:hypothetical protein
MADLTWFVGFVTFSCGVGVALLGLSWIAYVIRSL